MAWSSLHPLPGGPGLQACPPTARDIPHTHTQAVAGPGMELQLGARPDNGPFSSRCFVSYPEPPSMHSAKLYLKRESSHLYSHAKQSFL